MIKFNTIKMAAGVITFGAILFTQSVFAQQYKTAADTIKLNIAYGKATLEIAKLNADLTQEKNKTSGYQSKSATTALDAASAAQGSKTTADVATDGNAADAKIAMKQAKKANNEAKDARNAKSDEINNTKKIADLNDKIAKKQFELNDLARQKAVIMASLNPAPAVKN
jgi:hypothetical protein